MCIRDREPPEPAGPSQAPDNASLGEPLACVGLFEGEQICIANEGHDFGGLGPGAELVRSCLGPQAVRQVGHFEVPETWS
eukprot:12280912-Alexandrium_andersonii.AAC.1